MFFYTRILIYTGVYTVYKKQVLLDMNMYINIFINVYINVHINKKYSF